jgi:hypothetical protein
MFPPNSTQAPLPPLPNLPSAAPPQQGGGNGLEQMVSGLAPVKMGVDSILAGAKQIVQSGAVPGSEQVCAQIVALATSLLVMGAQSAMQPGQGKRFN